MFLRFSTLGVAETALLGLCAFAPYLQTGAPSVAQLANQWAALPARSLRPIARRRNARCWGEWLLAAGACADWSDQLGPARRQGATAFRRLFEVAWTALKRGDLAGAVNGQRRAAGRRQRL